VSGDTVLYDGVREVADRLRVDVALLHLGGVRFPVSGPVRYIARRFRWLPIGVPVELDASAPGASP
jgi:hypothetical protein